MIKQIVLIAAMAPLTAAAHDWDQHQWLQRWLDNRISIGKCLKLADSDIHAFHNQCDIDSFGTIENKEFARYQAEKLVHPLDDDLTFVTEHFASEGDEWIWAVYQNVVQTPAFNSAIIQMYIVQGLTKHKVAVHAPEGKAGAVNEHPGNNTIHDK